MFRRALVPAIVVALACCVSARAQVRFTWKLKAGEKFFIEEVVEQDLTFTVVGGKEMPRKSTTKRVSEFIVKSVDPDGYTLRQEILSWHSTSKHPDGKDGETHLEQVLGNSRFTVRLFRSGAIGRFDGYKDFMQRFYEVITPLEAKVLAPLLTEAALRSPLDMTFDVLPRRAIRPGEQYEKTIAVPVGPLGTCASRSKFTYQGQLKGIDEFRIKGDFTFEPGKQALGDTELKITKFELKSAGTTGTIQFDRALGRLVSASYTMPMSATMTMESKNTELDMLLKGTERRTIRLSRINPHNGSGT